MEIKENLEKIKKLDPKIWIFLYVLVSAVLLYFYPPTQISYFEINNSTTIATLENQYRATLTQILGGGAVAIGIYFTWKNFLTAQENLKTAQEGQITERLTRAIDQLGNEKLEIRLGGIYALERIANESEKDYWPIMEILTTYVRKNSPAEMAESQDKASLDIQAILTVIKRRRYFFNSGELDYLDLHETCLNGANLKGAHLEKVDFHRANLKDADLEGAYLQEADLRVAKLSSANLKGANLEEASLYAADFCGANLKKANLKGADLEEADLEGADLEGADLEGADLEGTYLKNTYSSPKFPGLGDAIVSDDQLSKVKTLYNAKLDEKLEKILRDKYPYLFSPTGKHPEDYVGD